MAICYGIKVMVCDECGKRWLPESENLPVQCPNRDCRSRNWHKSGKVYDAPDYIEHPDPTDQLRSATPAPPSTKADLMAHLGLTTASTMHQAQPVTVLPPVDDDEPAPRCTYTEYDPDTSETYRCGRLEHSLKIKHTRGARV